MPILSTDIQFYKSTTGVGLGGSISTTQIVSGNINNVFDNVDSAEAITGDTEYRCIFVKNNHASIDLLSAVIFILSNTSSDDTSIEIGLDPAGANNSATIIANEGTAPAGVVFDPAEDYANGLSIGTLDKNGGYYAIWIKRVVTPGAAAVASDTATLKIQGETTA